MTGDSSVGDDGILLLPKGESKNDEGRMEVVGLPKLRVLKLSGLDKMSDHALMKLVHSSKSLEHLELTKCGIITDYSIDSIIKASTTLKFIDLNGIPAITPQILDNLR